MTYEQAKADHEYLWIINAADDMTGGRVGTKLRELGLTRHGGWPTKYTATPAGRALAEQLREEG